MKKKPVLLFVVLLFGLTSFSQQKAIFNFKKIDSLITFNNNQKSLIKDALRERRESISSTSSQQEKFNINKEYVRKFKDIFDENQQIKVFVTQVNLDSVEKKSKVKLNKLTQKHKFPNDYKKLLEANIVDFEFNKKLVKQQFFYEPNLIQQKWGGLKTNFQSWRESEVSMLEKAKKLWKKTATKHDLDEKYKSSYIKYHFYLNHLEEQSPLIEGRIEKLTENKKIINVTKSIAKKETRRVISKCSAVQKLDSSSIKYASRKLFSHLKTITARSLSTKSKITLKRDSDLYCSYAFDKVMKRNNEKDSLRKIKKDKDFILRAKAIGLDSITANTILSLIETRKNDLNELKELKKNADETSELFENTDLKTKTEIKREFARNLANILNRKQFSQLFGNTFIKKVKKKSTSKIDDLKKTYELSDSQLEEITKMIKIFYFNQETTTAYFAFNKKLKKQKLSALRFKFENKYKELMKSFNLEVKPGVKVNNRTYLWKN